MIELVIAILVLALIIFVIQKLPLPGGFDWARQVILAIMVVCFLIWLLRFLVGNQIFGLIH